MSATEDKASRYAECWKLNFHLNATLIIIKMVEMNAERTERDTTVLVDEILHSIFFLGKINYPDFSPENIVTDAKMLKELKKNYPRAFDHYSSQLPKRSPFSCVLDMIVLLTGQEKEEEIKKKVREITKELKWFDKIKPLISSTICVSQFSNSHRYYGVSMCNVGRELGRIMVAASCLSYWDSYVSGAVMTYNPNNTKKQYFDGTIRLPENVRCEAFNILQDTHLPACRSCKNLFFKTDEKKEWSYGNCAEVESLSNLFKNVKEVKEQARLTLANNTDENRKKAEESVQAELGVLLKKCKFEWSYYSPQRDSS